MHQCQHSSRSNTYTHWEFKWLTPWLLEFSNFFLWTWGHTKLHRCPVNLSSKVVYFLVKATSIGQPRLVVLYWAMLRWTPTYAFCVWEWILLTSRHTIVGHCQNVQQRNQQQRTWWEISSQDSNRSCIRNSIELSHCRTASKRERRDTKIGIQKEGLVPWISTTSAIEELMVKPALRSVTSWM